MPFGRRGRFGPTGTSVPSTLLAYLQSISKASWYAIWIAGQGMAANSDGSGTVSDGGALGCWTSVLSSGFAGKFIQTTSASRPIYGASEDGLPAIGGNGTSWFLNLDTSSELNHNFTLLISGWMSTETAVLVSQSNRNFAVESSASGMDLLYIANSIVTAKQAPSSWTRWQSGTRARFRLGFTTTDTSHYNAPLNLLRRSTGTAFSTSRIYQVALVPELTAAQCDVAKTYLV